MEVTAVQAMHYINRLLDLAQSHLAAGRPEQASSLCYKVLEMQPENLEAPYLLAKLAASAGDYATAADLLDSIQLITSSETLLREYYEYHQKSGKLAQAVSFYRACVRQQPDNYTAWYCLARVCLGLNDRDGFLQAVLRAGRIQRSSPEANFELAELYEQAAIPTQAELHLRRCLELAPGNQHYRNCLANVLKVGGRANEATDYYANPLDSGTNLLLYHGFYTNYLMNFICTTNRSIEEIFTEHQRWGELCCRAVGEPYTSFSNEPSAGKKLKIGYVSSDFCRHPVAFFIEPLLTLHDRNHFEIFLYANVEREDDVTAQFKQRQVTWHQIFGVDDQDVCRMIREDGIDILVDLGGLTRLNRLPIFARRPSPVQITWLGYAHSTGLPTIDYRFTDEVADPPGMTEHLHTEQIYRLPDSFLGYHPPLDPPALIPLPCLGNGHITFGAFNNLAKTNDQLLGWWAEILKQVPDSRLLMKDTSFNKDFRFHEEWLDRFAALGITADRIGLLDRSPTVHSHMEVLGQCDIALDAYPYNGTTTTSETIWMGVPVVTLAGPSHVSRVSASLLTTVGVPELIAHTPEEYVRIAVELAADQERLKFYRANLRDMMQGSALMDFNGFARKIEAAYRNIWQRWCAERLADQDNVSHV